MSTARALVLAVLSFSCGRGADDRAPTRSDERAPVRRDAGGGLAQPAGIAVPPPRTTTGAIAVGNLHSRIRALEERLRSVPRDLDAMGELVQLYLQRADYLGTLTDFDRADALAERAAAEPGARGLVMRARVRGALHRFPAALADLDAAAALGTKGASERRDRTSFVLAMGRLEEAASLAGSAPLRGAESLYTRAAVQAALGSYEAAAGFYAEARASMHTTLPFPIAWTEFQEGLAWEQGGDFVRARERYEVAHARLPEYAAATAHLAGVLARVGETARASSLLEPLVASSDDPEYPAQLAELRRKEGRVAEADALALRARQGYDALLARHPQAFADHAARFFLTVDPARALALAEQNLAVRNTHEAIELLLDAALAANQPARACAAADAGLTSLAPVRLRVAAYRAYTACGRPVDAARVDPQPAPGTTP